MSLRLWTVLLRTRDLLVPGYFTHAMTIIAALWQLARRVDSGREAPNMPVICGPDPRNHMDGCSGFSVRYAGLTIHLFKIYREMTKGSNHSLEARQVK